MKKQIQLIVLVGFMLFSVSNIQSQTTIINPVTDGGFETGATFAANGWTVVNGGTNQWVCNTGATAGFSGVRCAYITNNTAGTPPPHTYTNTTAGAVHLYKDVTFPLGETAITFSFSIRMAGETGYDRVLVYISNAAPGAAPTAGTPASSGTAYAGYTLLSVQAAAGSWTSRTVAISAAQAGNAAAASTRRILFVWQNDSNTGSNPPVAIDNVSLTSNTPPTVVNMSNGSLTTCNATFYDPGGSGSNYSNNQNFTYTFCPATAGQYIRASFTSWGVEANFDYLSVFDGNSTSAPMIVGSSFSGTSPGTITATTDNTSGCLTFKFFSDGGTVGSGWTANVTCVATGATPPASVTAQDCRGAYTICSGANFNYQSSGPGIFNDANSGLGNRGCLNNYANTPNGSAEHQSVWAIFSPATNGTIGMTLDPAGSSTTDYDWAIWGPYTGSVPCPPQTTPLRCSAASAANSTGAMTGMGNSAADTEEGSGGNGWVSTINVTAGQLYLIMVDNWNATSAPLTLSWQLTNGATLDCTPLPIELVTFTGKAEGKNNYLEWITASEINNDYFTIERSIDGTVYTDLRTVNGSGTTHESKTYSTIDFAPAKGINYYRLKQTDFDGTSKYSGIVAVDNSNIEGAVSNIHPNPTNGDLNFDFSSPINGTIYLQIFDYTGRIVIEENITVVEGINSLKTTLNNLANGMYSMKIILNQTGFSSVTKIIKQ